MSYCYKKIWVRGTRGEEQAICTLLIVGENNEKRTVCDPNRAKYRCSKALVVSIRRIRDGVKFLKGRSLSPELGYQVYYHVNTFVTPHNGYDRNIDDVCAGGIHYFKTREAAVDFEIDSSTMKNCGCVGRRCRNINYIIYP